MYVRDLWGTIVWAVHSDGVTSVERRTRPNETDDDAPRDKFSHAPPVMDLAGNETKSGASDGKNGENEIDLTDEDDVSDKGATSHIEIDLTDEDDVSDKGATSHIEIDLTDEDDVSDMAQTVNDIALHRTADTVDGDAATIKEIRARYAHVVESTRSMLRIEEDTLCIIGHRVDHYFDIAPRDASTCMMPCVKVKSAKTPKTLDSPAYRSPIVLSDSDNEDTVAALQKDGSVVDVSPDDFAVGYRVYCLEENKQYEVVKRGKGFLWSVDNSETRLVLSKPDQRVYAWSYDVGDTESTVRLQQNYETNEYEELVLWFVVVLQHEQKLFERFWNCDEFKMESVRVLTYQIEHYDTIHTHETRDDMLARLHAATTAEAKDARAFSPVETRCEQLLARESDRTTHDCEDAVVAYIRYQLKSLWRRKVELNYFSFVTSDNKSCELFHKTLEALLLPEFTTRIAHPDRLPPFEKKYWANDTVYGMAAELLGVQLLVLSVHYNKKGNLVARTTWTKCVDNHDGREMVFPGNPPEFEFDANTLATVHKPLSSEAFEDEVFGREGGKLCMKSRWRNCFEIRDVRADGCCFYYALQRALLHRLAFTQRVRPRNKYEETDVQLFVNVSRAVADA